jgi:mannosyltransferase
MSAGALGRRMQPTERPRAGRTGVSRVTLAVGGLTVLAAALRFYGLGHQGYWYDEATTAMLVRFSPGKMLGLIPQSESTPPLYYCIAWVWARLFGDGEAGLRSLSALAGVALVPVAYAAAAKLVSRRAGLVCAALAACNPFLVWYSQEARSYELLVLLTGAALLAFAYAREEPSARHMALWAASSALALATHYFAVVVIVPQACWLLFEHRRRRPVLIGVAVVGMCGLALIPLALSQNGTGNDGWIATAPLRERLAQIIPQFLIGTNAPHRMVLKFAAIVLALGALALLTRRTLRAQRRGALVASGIALSGFAISLALIVGGFDDLITRNIIELWLPAAIVLAAGLAAPRAGRLGLALALALCAIGIIGDVAVAADHSLQRPDWRPVARALGPAPTGVAGRAILIQHYAYRLPLSLYMRRLVVMGRAARVTELDVISMRSPQQPLCWWGAACNLIPSSMQSAYSIRGLRSVSEQHVAQFTIRRLTSARPIRLTRAEVAAALRTTTLRHDVLLIQRP